MSLNFNIVPVEQWAAQMLAGEIIAATAGSDPVKRVADANVALEWAGGIQQLAAGDPTSALAALTAQLGKSSWDPAVVDGLQNMLGFGLQQVSVKAQITKFIPFFGATAKAVADNVAAGVTAAANIEISTYTPKIPQASSKSQSAGPPAATAA
ncbi:MAG TPA: hypothetical protein VFX20_18050 [Steroidobacteraceae bacterium]|nr:hypothetical protein [Steroidobacteraceae bacterium]